MDFHGGFEGFEHGGSGPGTEVLEVRLVLEGGGEPCHSPIPHTLSLAIGPR